MAGDEPISFDEYCELHGIQGHEYGAAFAAYLNEISGGEWDSQVRKVESARPATPARSEAQHQAANQQEADQSE